MPLYWLRARRFGVEDLVLVERALLAEVLQAFTSLEGALGPVLEQWQTTVVEAPKRDEVGRQRGTERLSTAAMALALAGSPRPPIAPGTFFCIHFTIRATEAPTP